MKPHLLFSAILLSAFILFAFRFNEKQKRSSFDLTEYKKKNTIRCGPDWDKSKDWLEKADIPPIPGAGIYKWKISTKSDSAQFYFNQGINMYYSFHIIEAMASFKKAAKFDKNSPMLYWAQALAEQTQDKNLQARFAKIAKELEQNEAKITAELLGAQGKPVDMGGYYHPNDEKTTKAMRPSQTFNAIVDAIA